MTIEGLESESDQTPQPDLYFEPELVVPESPHDNFVDIFAGTKLPLSYRDIHVFRIKFRKHVSIVIQTEVLENALESSGNEFGLHHWQKNRRALNLTGMGLRPKNGKFIDPATDEELPLKEVLKRKRKNKS